MLYVVNSLEKGTLQSLILEEISSVWLASMSPHTSILQGVLVIGVIIRNKLSLGECKLNNTKK